MKKIWLGTAVGFALILGVQGARASFDPVKDYLERFSPLGGGPQFYSDDTLLRLDFDLDGDGVNEVLLSIARDRNGKQGNGWQVYKKEKDQFTNVGGITFSGGAFFVGPVEEIRGHGLVTFWSAGGGEGQIFAYSIEKGAIKETKIGELARINGTERMRGQRVYDKYLGSGRKSAPPEVQEIPAHDFVPRYRLPVEPITYRESFSVPSVPEPVASVITAPQSATVQEEVLEPARPEAFPGAGVSVLMQPQQVIGSLPEVPRKGPELEPASRLPLSVGRDIFLSVFLVGFLTAIHFWVKGRRTPQGR